MKKYVVMLLSLVLLVVAIAAAVCLSPNAEGNIDDIVVAPKNAEETSVPDSVDELLTNLDLSGVQGIIDALDTDQISALGFKSIADRLRASIDGDKNDFGSVMSYVLSLLGADILEYLPMLLSVVAIVVAYSMINSVKSDAFKASTERVVYFATGAVAVTLVVGYFSVALAGAVAAVTSVKTQINTVAPILITLMTASGATASAGIYSPTVAALGGAMTNAVTYLAFPALLMSLVFDIIGSVSTSVKLDKMSEFFRSACKWFLGTAFFLFVTVVGVSGITASVRDGVSVRAARFAVSKYVPVIGGYLSQGFDFLMAGNILIKNALGTSAVVLIVLSVAPTVARLAVFTLTLKLTAAVCEPIGGSRFSGVLSSISKSSSMIATVVIAMTFLYVIFLSMTVCTGNLGV